MVTLSASGSYDPDGDWISYSWDLNGDGSYYDAYGETTWLTPSDNGTWTVGVMASAIDGFSTATRQLTVNNASPTFAYTPTLTGGSYVGEAVQITATFSDPANSYDTYTAQVDWGAGSGWQSASVSGNQITASLPNGYQAGNTYTVKLKISDEDGGSTEWSQPLTVQNLVVTLTGDASTPEGSLYGLTLGANTSVDSWQVQWGDSSSDSLTGSTSSASHTYTDDPTGSPDTRTISVTATKGTVTVTQTKTVTVSNAVPTFAYTPTLTGGSYVGEAVQVTATFSDPANSYDTYTAQVDWGAGSGWQSASVSGNQITAGLPNGYQAGNTYTVKLKISDEDGGSTEWSQPLTVQNLVVTLTGDASTPEGSLYGLTLGANTSVDSWQVQWGDSSSDSLTGSTSSASHTYTDDPTGSPDTRTISVTATKGTVTVTQTKTVTVNNVAPSYSNTPTLTGGSYVGEAVQVTATFSDPANSYDTYTAQVDWGAGSGWQSASVSGNQITASLPNGYQAGNTYTVKLKISDEDGGETVWSTSANPQVISLTATGASTVLQGQSFTIHFSASAPVDGWTINFGDGTSLLLGSGATSASHNYNCNGFTSPQNWSASATAYGVTYSASGSVSVQNVDPVIDWAQLTPGTIRRGQSTGLLGHFTDPGFGQESYWWDVDWGDGSPVENGLPTYTQLPPPQTHIYTTLGTYTVQVTLHDSNGGGDEWSGNVEVVNAVDDQDLGEVAEDALPRTIERYIGRVLTEVAPFTFALESVVGISRTDGVETSQPIDLSAFRIDSATGDLYATINHLLDYEQVQTYLLVVNEAEITFDLLDQNEQPQITSLETHFHVSEFAQPDDPVLTFLLPNEQADFGADDPDVRSDEFGPESLTWSILDDVPFRIDEQGRLFVSESPDPLCERYEFVVQVEDGGGLVAQVEVDVTLDDLNWEAFGPLTIDANDGAGRIVFYTDPPEGEDEQADDADGTAIQFDLVDVASHMTLDSGTGTIIHGLTSWEFDVPPEYLLAGTSLQVRVNFVDDTRTLAETRVAAGAARDLQWTMKVLRPDGSSTIWNPEQDPAPLIRHELDAVEINVRAVDLRGNPVVDGTAISFDDHNDSSASSFAGPPMFQVGSTMSDDPVGLTLDGRVPILIPAGKLPSTYRLRGRIDDYEESAHVTGEAVRIVVTADDYSVDVSSPNEVNITAVVTTLSGAPVPDGTPIQWWDRKKLLTQEQTVVTNGQATAKMRLPWSGLFSGTEVLGENYFAAIVAGYRSECPDGPAAVTYTSTSSAPRIDPAGREKLIAGDLLTDGSRTVTYADGTTREVPFRANLPIEISNLTAGEVYRIRIEGNSNLVDIEGDTEEHVFTAAGTTASFVVRSRGTLETNSAGLTNTLAKTIKLTVEQRWVIWNPLDPFGLVLPPIDMGWTGLGPEAAHRLQVMSADGVVRAKQGAHLFGRVLWGAAVGSDGLDAEMAGDLGLSILPVVGVYCDVRDLVGNLAKFLPLNLGDPDCRELAIAFFGILAEALPPADVVVDSYRVVYKIAKGAAQFMPLFLAFEPVVRGAMQELWTWAWQQNWTSRNTQPLTHDGDEFGAAIQALADVGPNMTELANWANLIGSLIEGFFEELAGEAAAQGASSQATGTGAGNFFRAVRGVLGSTVGGRRSVSALKHINGSLPNRKVIRDAIATAFEDLADDEFADAMLSMHDLMKRSQSLNSVVRLLDPDIPTATSSLTELLLNLGRMFHTNDRLFSAATQALVRTGNANLIQTMPKLLDVTGDMAKVMGAVGGAGVNRVAGALRAIASTSPDLANDVAILRGRWYDFTNAAQLIGDDLPDPTRFSFSYDFRHATLLDPAKWVNGELDLIDLGRLIGYENKLSATALGTKKDIMEKAFAYLSAGMHEVVFILPPGTMIPQVFNDAMAELVRRGVAAVGQVRTNPNGIAPRL